MSDRLAVVSRQARGSHLVSSSTTTAVRRPACDRTEKLSQEDIRGMSNLWSFTMCTLQVLNSASLKVSESVSACSDDDILRGGLWWLYYNPFEPVQKPITNHYQPVHFLLVENQQ